MEQKEIIFYIHSSEPMSINLKLIDKLYTNKENVLFLCENEEEMKKFDLKLWSYAKTSFIPHCSTCSLDENIIPYCHTLISTEIRFDNHPTCLMHNGLNIEQHENISKFSKIIDVLHQDFGKKERAVFYHQLGFEQQKSWLRTNNGAWEKAE